MTSSTRLWQQPVLRFAPSPNGELHLGHAYSALVNFDLARRWDGKLLLRIEDIDTTRCTPAFEAGIHRDLKWLGISWEPEVRRQSQHFDAYRAVLDRLIAEGLVYPAFMSRGDIRAHIRQHANWPLDPDGAPLYPALDKGLAPARRDELIAGGKPFAWRLDMAAAIDRLGGALSWRELTPDTGELVEQPAEPQRWGDVILARSDIPTSYHLSVVVDDALQGVTHVVRGRDLFHATAVHRVLQQLLRLPEPIYHHHGLILDADGHKLSKSEKSKSLAALRDAGETPASIRAMLGLAP